MRSVSNRAIHGNEAVLDSDEIGRPYDPMRVMAGFFLLQPYYVEGI